MLPNWLLSGLDPSSLILGVHPMPDSDSHVVEVCDLKAKMSLRPRFNVPA